jgi:hypothetical protein
VRIFILSLLSLSIMQIKGTLPENKNTSTEIKSISNTINSAVEYRSLETAMKVSLSRLLEKGLVRKEIYQELISKEQQFAQMASECFPGENIEYVKRVGIQGSFMGSIQISNHNYLLPLTCAWGRGSNGYVIFAYNSKKGLKMQPLSFDTVVTDQFGQVSIEKKTVISSKRIYFDMSKQELLSEINCHYNDGTTQSKYVYKFYDGLPILVEYWRDNLENEKCLKKPELQKIDISELK